jgi:ribosome biogenesis GTPase
MGGGAFLRNRSVGVDVPRGTVYGTGGGVYRVSLDDGSEVDALLRGRLKMEARTGDRVVIGDRVRVEESAGAHVIEEVEPRRRQVVRRGPGGRKAKVVAANLDTLVIVMAARSPDPLPEAIDRLLVVAEADDLRGVLVLNKLDLAGAREAALPLADLYRGIGYETVLVSARTGEGLDELRTILCRGTSALVGPSGTGKSSLLNVVEPGLGLRTGELSRRGERGRHTTVSARLIRISCGTAVADTPGFGDVGVWGVGVDELQQCFPEFRTLLGECRFRRCAHVHEPGCAVRAALEEGRIAPSRYQSYVALRQEALAER